MCVKCESCLEELVVVCVSVCDNVVNWSVGRGSSGTVVLCSMK